MAKAATNRTADLHVHTSFSDGVLDPEELVHKALELGVGTIAITDHDCIDGISLAVEAARNTDLEIIPGLELSVYIDDIEAHLLGYFVDTENTRLKAFLGKLRQKRKKRVLEMIALLKGKGLYLDPLTFDTGEKTGEKKGTVGRMNLARALLNAGLVGSIKEAFNCYIGNGQSCCVRHSKLSYIDGIDLITSCGGVPVLAHPGTIDDSAYVQKCVSAGIMGIEVYHPKHKPYQVLKYENFARQNNLIITGGSDCHGISRNNSLLLGTVTVNHSIIRELKEKSGNQNV